MSLGLVSYDDSDGSENESDSEENLSLIKNSSKTDVTPTHSKTNVETKKGLDPSNGSGHISDDELEPTTNSMNGSAHISDEELEPNKSWEKTTNLHLPEAKLSLINTDIDIKCLTSTVKKSGPVKITIPSLNEVTDESEPPSKKKLKPSQKGSGLFALLPSPKSSLVPQSVANKRLLNPTKKPTPALTPAKKHTPAPRVTAAPTLVPRVSSLICYDDSGDEDDTSETNDFFSLESKDKDINPAPIDVNIDIPETSTSVIENVGVHTTSSVANTSDWQGPTKPTGWEGSMNVQQPSSSHTAQASVSQNNFGYTTSEFMSISNNDLELDQQAMQQLCGRRDRHKMQEVNLIDVSGDAIMPDSREWLTKQLTEEVAHRPSHKRKDGPTTQQKRKHQITYLAYQAKENELELKNQWSNNRMSRKQTQAKYGF